jgi:hypothetical protein
LEGELESRISDIERRLSKLEAALIGTQSVTPRSNDLEAKLVENAEKLKTQEMIIISLKIHGKQTKEQIKTTLQDWGKVYGNWFEGGNFNGRLVKKNIVKKEDKNEKNEESFSLTKRGDMLADELIAKANAG